MQRTIVIYERPSGKNPFLDWLLGLKDRKVRAIIRARLNRIELGNLGDCKSVGDGVFEFRISYGPGYRVYFGKVGEVIVVLRCGGDKGTQRRDIENAKNLWKEYKDGTKKLP
jgi:putative addiction module killer protein